MAGFNLERKQWWRRQLALLKTYRTYVQGNPLARMDRLLLFTGYPRSGHTLVGALLDAHPQVVIAHQAGALTYFERGLAKERVFQLLLDNATRFTASGREWMGYTYRIPGQWQGKYRDLKIIGDKSGGITTRKIFEQGDFSGLDQMIDRSGAKPVFVHVIRNPFDIITTMAKRSMARQDKPVKEDDLRRKIGHFFNHAEGVSRLKNHGRFRVIDVYSEQMAHDTKTSLSHLCRELGLDVDEAYLAACDQLVWDKPKTSRNSLPFWSPELITMVQEQMNQFPWFADYTFTSGGDE